MKLIPFLAAAMVFGYANEHFRIKPLGYWAVSHSGIVQLFIPSQEKLKVVEKDEELENKVKKFSWMENRSGGLLKPCSIIVGIIYLKGLMFSPFGSVFENIASVLFKWVL